MIYESTRIKALINFACRRNHCRRVDIEQMKCEILIFPSSAQVSSSSLCLNKKEENANEIIPSWANNHTKRFQQPSRVFLETEKEEISWKLARNVLFLEDVYKSNLFMSIKFNDCQSRYALTWSM